MVDKKKPKELDWEEKTYKFIKNILLDAEEKKVPHPVLISQIFSLLTQQRTELLEEIKKMEMKVDTTFWEEHERAMPKGYNKALKDVTNLLNKKDE